jgi:hypothetical protein
MTIENGNSTRGRFNWTIPYNLYPYYQVTYYLSIKQGNKSYTSPLLAESDYSASVDQEDPMADCIWSQSNLMDRGPSRGQVAGVVAGVAALFVLLPVILMVLLCIKRHTKKVLVRPRPARVIPLVVSGNNNSSTKKADMVETASIGSDEEAPPPYEPKLRGTQNVTLEV